MKNTHYYGANKAIVSVTDTNFISAPNANNQPKEYVVNHWYGLL